ncbi:MAG TPA: NYN domain-containing protein [Candidatus Limnocylindrales bacterium]|nr:NYN domain-containing protein [Candidatus Limnocylindrales bacterium]
MTRPVSRRNPLEGVTQLLVDGTNLLHALSRGPTRQPPAALIGRLRGAVPAETKIVLVFDGPPEPGVRGERIAGGVSVQYGGRYSADTILVTLVEDATAGAVSPAKAADAILVVTDDRDLRHALARRGARTAGARWLIGRIERPRLASPSIGNPRPPLPPRIPQQRPGEDVTNGDDGTESRRWAPGRGATAKRGNPRRAKKGERGHEPGTRG